jgi:hypothetical protein
VTESAVDPLYREARRVLLDALDALEPHLDSVILTGAQAVYLRAGANSLPVADYTSDGDLVLDPATIEEHPPLEDLMRDAGFELEVLQGAEEPGLWAIERSVAGRSERIEVDLIVPATVAPRPGRRRGAFGPPHGKRAARKISGLEAALADNSEMTVGSLDPDDDRRRRLRVAGVAGLVVATCHKLSDRLGESRDDRLDDKDAADVFRLVSATEAAPIATTLERLRSDPIAGAVTAEGIVIFERLFGSRAGDGIAMAARALRLGVPEERIRAICLDYAEVLRGELAHR